MAPEQSGTELPLRGSLKKAPKRSIEIFRVGEGG